MNWVKTSDVTCYSRYIVCESFHSWCSRMKMWRVFTDGDQVLGPADFIKCRTYPLIIRCVEWNSEVWYYSAQPVFAGNKSIPPQGPLNSHSGAIDRIWRRQTLPSCHEICLSEQLSTELPKKSKRTCSIGSDTAAERDNLPRLTLEDTNSSLYNSVTLLERFMWEQSDINQL